MFNFELNAALMIVTFCQLTNHSGEWVVQIMHRPNATSYLYNSNRRQQEVQQRNKRARASILYCVNIFIFMNKLSTNCAKSNTLSQIYFIIVHSSQSVLTEKKMQKHYQLGVLSRAPGFLQAKNALVGTLPKTF